MDNTKITRGTDAYPYRPGLIRPDDPGYNPVAHGGCSFVERDTRGRTRIVNINGGQEEVGPWR